VLRGCDTALGLLALVPEAVQVYSHAGPGRLHGRRRNGRLSAGPAAGGPSCTSSTS